MSAIPIAGEVEAASTVTQTFSYTGSTQTFTVPAGVTEINVVMKGGEGGRGGTDYPTPNAGGYQGVIRGTIAVTPGQVITVAVGGGGSAGAQGGSAPGGGGGQNPLTGYDGSTGGTAGPQGSSGGGGGGGAATVLRVGAADVVAGGAGGNGGNGQFLALIGRVAEDHHIARSDATSTTGRPGLNTTVVCSVGFGCDGGASGAGGGGAQGGERGDVQYGGGSNTEYFGFGGAPGANSDGGLGGLVGTFEYYSGNSANGSITFTYDDGAPGAPMNLAGTAHTNAVGLVWDAPASSGASAITDYRVEHGTSASGPWTTFNDGVSTDLTTEVTGLTNGTGYFFRVTAINTQGLGSSAVTSVAIVPSDVPSPPTVTGTVAFGNGFHVDFTPGASHAPILGYQYRLDGGEWTTGSVSGNRLTINGLTNGREYSVELREVNSIGVSTTSNSATATPRDVPQAPSGVQAVGGDATIDLTWVAPVDDNGSAVTDYVVQFATVVGGPYSTFTDGTSTTTSATITGVSNGQTYYVRVSAVNAMGTGPASANAVATPYTIPDAPTISLTGDDGSLDVEISPYDNGGSEVTLLEYRVDGGPWHTTGSLYSTFTITGLENATSYDVEVRATNAAGTGAASYVVSGTPYGVPAAPSISAVALDTGSVSVAFSVGSDGGSPLTNIEYSIDGGINWITRSPASTASPLTVSGLTGGQTYPIVLRALNAAGPSVGSNESSVTAKGTPEAPSIVLAPADRSLTVTIDAPLNGGSPITDYEYSIDGGAWTSTATTTTRFVIDGLTNGTDYDVRVRAVNAAGNSVASSIVTGTPRTTPGAPTIVGGTTSDVSGVIDVDFTAPADDGGSEITGYEYSTDGGHTWQPRATGTTGAPLSISTQSDDGVTLLDGGVEYPVEIRAVNVAGAGLASAVAVGITTTAPGTPLIDDVVSHDGSAEIIFVAPANGGSPITGYEYRLDGGPWVDTGTLAEVFTVTVLTNGTSYSLELRAVNAIGAGAATEAVWANGEATPSAPAITGSMPSDGRLTVAFTPPSSDGGSTIIGYEYSTDGGITWRERSLGSTDSPLVITTDSAHDDPLVNGTVYPVQIRAINAAGAGLASDTHLVAPQGAPDAPTGFAVTPGDTTLTLEFTIASDGGSALTALSYSIDGGPWITAGSMSSPLTITGLMNGTEYHVALRAENSNGAGAATSSLPGTPSALPDAPQDVTVAPGAARLTVEWTAPADDGGAAVDSYTASAYSQAAGGDVLGTCTTSTLTCEITGLANGTTVYVEVTAHNTTGNGVASAPRVAATPVATPVVTVGSVATATTELTVTASVTSDGGTPITGYEYQLDGGTWTAGGASSPFTISGLVNGQTYSLRIRAINAVGTGVQSPAVDVVPHTTPTVPLALVATSAPQSAVLAWNAPASNGGRSVTDYVVQYSTSSSGPFSTFADGTSATTGATVTGLTNSTLYYFRVAAVNTAGTGPWSALAAATPRSAPSAPTISTITPGSGYLTVAFTAPSDNGGASVTGYQYRLDGGAWTNASSASSPIAITGLTNGTNYAVQLRAVNSVGAGAASNTISAKPYGLPAGVVGFRAYPSGGTVVLDWDAVNDNGSPITAYNIIRWSALTEGTISASYTTTSTTYTVPSLGNGTYYFTIEATNAAGTGPRTSPRTTAIVGNTAPAAPTLNTVITTGTAVQMSWTAGAANSSPITSYIVQYSTDGTTWTTASSGSASTSASFTPAGAATHVRVAAVSATGVGPFATGQPPIAGPAVVLDVTATSATVNGGVNANGTASDVWLETAATAAELGTPASAVTVATPASVSGSSTTPVTVGLSGLTPGQQVAARWMASSSGFISYGPTVTFTTDAEITTTVLDYEYTGSPVVPTATLSPSNLPVTRTYVGVSGTVYPSSTTAPTNVGTYDMTTVPTNNSIGGSETVTITISPKPVTVTVAAIDRDYDGSTDVALILGLDGDVVGDDVSANPDALTGTIPAAGAATEVLVEVDRIFIEPLLTGSDADNYTPTVDTADVFVDIAMADQTLSFTTTPPSPFVAGDTYDVAATSSFELPVDLAIDSGEGTVCTISGSTVTAVGAGHCVVAATQDGTDDIVAATPEYQEFDVVATPGAVTGLALEAGDHSITVTFSVPAATGGSPITGYAVSTGGHSCIPQPYVPGPTIAPVSTYRCTITGLTNAVSHAVTVTAENEYGTGAPAVLSAIPFGLPGTPVVTVTGAGSHLTVSWTEPSSNGRSITGYEVYVGGQLHSTVGSSPRSLAIEVTPNGQPLTIGVKAINVAGTGTAGEVVVTPADPQIQLQVDVTPGDEAADAPVHVTGSGLMPNSEVRIELRSGTTMLLGTVTTDATGSFSTTVHLPAAVAAGDHEVVVVARRVDDAPMTETASLFVDWTGTTAWVDDTTNGGGSGPGGSGSPSELTSITPLRVLDTRDGGGAKLAAGGVQRLAFPAAVLPAGVEAVAVNVTVTQPEADGFITVYPCDNTRPDSSALNYARGETVANLVIAAQRSGGDLCFYSLAATHLVVDVTGYYSPDGDALVPMTPVRVADSRLTHRVAAGTSLVVDVTGEGKAPENAAAVALHVAATDADAQGFLTVYPCGEQVPLASTLNMTSHRTVGNSTLSKVGADGNVCIYTLVDTDIVVDLVGSATSGSGTAYRALVPGRVLDTRTATRTTAGGTMRLDFASVASGAAVALNVAVVNAASDGYVTVFPCGVERPLAASVNHHAGQTHGTQVMVGVGADHGVCVYTSSATDLVVDVQGIVVSVTPG